MKTILKCALFFIIASVPIVPVCHIITPDYLSSLEMNNEVGNKEVIHIALYDSISPSVNLLEKVLNYEWKKKQL